MASHSFPRTIRLSFVLLVAGAWAAICVLSTLLPSMLDFERRYGLPLLFLLRGERPPPEESVIVRIDHRAASSILLPQDADQFYRCKDIRVGHPSPTHRPLPAATRLVEWPRCIHTELIKVLHRAGARLIAFDVLFRPRPGVGVGAQDVRAAEDQRLASAIQSAGNVLLSRRLDSQAAAGESSLSATSAELSELSADLERAALGSGIFLLPDPEFGRFDRFVAFTSNNWLMSAFPALSVQVYLRAAFDPFRRLLIRHSPHAAELMSDQHIGIDTPGAIEAAALLARQLMVEDQMLIRRLHQGLSGDSAEPDPEIKREVLALARMYASPGQQYFNFYGPPGHIRSIGLEEVLDVSREQYVAQAVRGKVVFVGRSELNQPEKDDYFHTVFSGVRGIDTSGVELAATAFSNLLHGDSIERAGPWTMGVVAFIVGFTVVCLMAILPMALGAGVVIVLMLCYVAIAIYAFTHHHLWLPVALPIGIQGGIAVLAVGTWVYWRTRRYAGQMRRMFGHFVPPALVDKVMAGRQSLGDLRESMKAACMATDVERYVSVAEGLDPGTLSDYLDRYFAVLFGMVTKHDGLVTDVVGDAMMAIWPDRNEERAIRVAVCDACLDIATAVDDFNDQSELSRLRTRIGVDWGSIALGPVGAAAHFEFRAIGDPVNTSNRIQNFNKRMGTWVLVSAAVVEGLDEFLTRDIGNFRLRGKQIPVTLHELLCRKISASASQRELCERFDMALRAAQAGQVQEALALFQQLEGDFPNDGPTRYYINMLRKTLNPDLRVISAE